MIGSFKCMTADFSSLTNLLSVEDSTQATSGSPLTPTCTAEQLDIIQKMLPSKQAIQRFTNCPDPKWLEEDLSWLSRDESPTQPLVAVFAGCNKGYDAVNTLRMLSNNPRYDKFAWREEIAIGSRGACNQEYTPQYTIRTNDPQRSAKVHCIEAMPLTLNHLKQSAEKLGWKEDFIVHHAALSDSSGTIPFPDVSAGREDLGIAACLDSKQRYSCKNVSMTTLDAYVNEKISKESVIDYLSIDVEGYDWPVLQGSSQILNKVKFLEFEAHYQGVWANTNLSRAIDFLKPYNFVCYWNGRHSKLWRITECFREDYNTMKAWSNVACVNIKRLPELARRMEKQFNKTLSDFKE